MAVTFSKLVDDARKILSGVIYFNSFPNDRHERIECFFSIRSMMQCELFTSQSGTDSIHSLLPPVSALKAMVSGKIKIKDYLIHVQSRTYSYNTSFHPKPARSTHTLAASIAWSCRKYRQRNRHGDRHQSLGFVSLCASCIHPCTAFLHGTALGRPLQYRSGRTRCILYIFEADHGVGINS